MQIQIIYNKISIINRKVIRSYNLIINKINVDHNKIKILSLIISILLKNNNHLYNNKFHINRIINNSSNSVIIIFKIFIHKIISLHKNKFNRNFNNRCQYYSNNNQVNSLNK